MGKFFWIIFRNFHPLVRKKNWRHFKDLRKIHSPGTNWSCVWCASAAHSWSCSWNETEAKILSSAILITSFLQWIILLVCHYWTWKTAAQLNIIQNHQTLVVDSDVLFWPHALRFRTLLRRQSVSTHIAITVDTDQIGGTVSEQQRLSLRVLLSARCLTRRIRLEDSEDVAQTLDKFIMIMPYWKRKGSL